MKLIIDIPEEQYNDIVKHLTDNDGNYAYSDFNLREIIRNGTPYNPTSDAISRSALKTELETYRHTRNYKSDEDEAQNALLDNVLEDIDNAKAIPLPNNQVAWDQGYEAGLAQGKQDRPQGEWIKEDNGKTTDIYRCSICGRSIMLCKNADLSKYPFCHCGADMRKGGKQ